MLTVAALAVQEGCDCMTVEEKRNIVEEYCDTHSCEICRLRNVWVSEDQKPCLTISYADESELNWALDIINPAPKTEPVSEPEAVPETMPDNVNHPAHYETGKFECIDVMVETQGEEAVKAYCLCAAFKYLYRHNRKNGLEDIKKARWYLDKYVELEEGEADG